MDNSKSLIKCHKPYVFKREVDWPDLDQLNHVNNKIFYRWIEISRTNYFHHLRLENFHENPRLDFPSIIIAEVSCKFLSPLNWPDTVEVRTQTTHIGKTSWILITEIWSMKQNKKVAEGMQVVVFFDYKINKPTPIPSEIKNEIIKFEELEFIVNPSKL